MSFYTWIESFSTQVRRSVRLQKMGYYRGEDFDESELQLRSRCLQEPVICYKETPYRPRRRQRQQPLQPEPMRMDRGTSPHPSTFQRDFGTSPDVSTSRRDQATSPDVSTSRRDQATSPDVSTSRRDQATSPDVSTSRRDQATSYEMDINIKADITSRRVQGNSAHVRPVQPKRLEDKGTQTYWPEETRSTWSRMILRMLAVLLWTMVVFYMSQQAGVHRIFDGTQKILNEDKTAINGGQMWRKDQKILNEDQKILNGDQTWLQEDQKSLNEDEILNEDQTILKDDPKILNEEKKILNEDQTILKDDPKILNEDKKILNEDQTILKDDPKILNEEKKILNEDQAILHDTINGWRFFVVGKKDSIYFNLPQTKVPTHLTLAHIAKVKAANGALATAPRDFSLYGMRDGEEHLLGRLTYNENGAAAQTFTVPGQEAYRTLRLAMDSNWGDTAFTCFHVWLHDA